MAVTINRGKQFEEIFKQQWKKSFPNGTIDRLYDTTNGFKTISNVCDFICYNYPNIFYLECKSHYGNIWPFTCFTQYEKLLSKINIKGVFSGVILWMIDHDLVVFLPVDEIKKMKEDGLKSFNVKLLNKKDSSGKLLYNIIEIPSIKKRVFLESDYAVLCTRGEQNDRQVE